MADKIKISEMTPATSIVATDTVAGVVSGASKSITAEQFVMVQSLTDTRWVDLRFPLARDKQGATQKPDYDYTNMGLLFPKNDTAEIAYFIGQMPHYWKIGTDLYPHVHFTQYEDIANVYKIDYRWYVLGGDPTGGFTTLELSSFVYTYTSGSISQIASSATAIDGSGITGVSSIIEVKLYRDDNLGSGDLLTKEFDIHYEIDSLGSDTEFVK